MFKSLAIIALGLIVSQSIAIATTPYASVITGRAEVKRKTASQDSLQGGFQKIKKEEPVPLQMGDQLRLQRGAIVSLICPGDKTPIILSRAEERLGLPALCPKWKPVIGKGPPPIAQLHGTNPQQPFLISPHRSLLLNPVPIIRWNPIPGATEYTVRIKASQNLVWESRIQGNQVVYPGISVLKPATPYRIEIQTQNLKSSWSNGNEFLVLLGSEAKAIQKDIDQINQIDVSPELKSILIADYYAGYTVSNPLAYGLTEQTAARYRLTADAIAVIEASIKRNGPTLLLYRKLGDLYAQSGVMYPAEQAYLKAIERVRSLEDLEEWALIMYSLGELNEVANNPQIALQWYNQARIGFSLLEDSRVGYVERSIIRLKSRSTNPASIGGKQG